MILLNKTLVPSPHLVGTLPRRCNRAACLPRKLHNRGFTLVELVVVVAIIGVLSAIGMSGFAQIKVQARNTRAAGEIRVIEKDINAYAVEKGTYPPSLAEIGRNNLIDPWGHRYEYRLFSAGNMRTIAGVDQNPDYDLFSVGSDADFAQSLMDPKSRDDIVRLNEGRWVGYVANY